MIKLLLLFIVLISVGVVILPETVSIFYGQHEWYSISGEGNQIPCRKCHADVYEELKNNPYHTNFTCELCHRGVKLTYASDYGGSVYGGNEAHAASTQVVKVIWGNSSGSGWTSYPESKWP